MTFCRLRADPVELDRRLRSRYRPDDVVQAPDEADALDRRDSNGLFAATGAGAPLDVAVRVAEVICSATSMTGRSPSGSQTAAPEARSADDGSAFLVCGPTGVGMSSVGFGPFNSLLADGRTAAHILDRAELELALAGVG